MFIFTLKNDHGVEPTRFMKRRESRSAIKCVHLCGPIFGDVDIFIGNNCNKENNCFIINDGKNSVNIRLIKLLLTTIGILKII